MKKPLEKLRRRIFYFTVARITSCLRFAKADQIVNGVFREWYELPVDPVHFYSPLPDIKKVRANLARWRRESRLPGVRMDLDKQAAFLRELKPFSPECNGLPSFDKIAKLGYGLGYGEVEAHFLHCMVRYLKPRLIIEVGAGVSTYFSLKALEMNARDSNPVPGEMICIEPYPSQALQALENEKRVTLDVKEVQDVPLSLFATLAENDVLFIDSSHAGKIDSDVYFIYLEILPRLKPGVVVHIHDICFPFLTCPPESRFFPLSLLWNEGALCQAFLAFNDTFEILACQSYLHHRRPSALGGLLSAYDHARHFPSSLWLRKRT